MGYMYSIIQLIVLVAMIGFVVWIIKRFTR